MNIDVKGYVMSCVRYYYIASGIHFRTTKDDKHLWQFSTPEKYFDEIKRRNI